MSLFSSLQKLHRIYFPVLNICSTFTFSVFSFSILLEIKLPEEAGIQESLVLVDLVSMCKKYHAWDGLVQIILVGSCLVGLCE